METGYAHVVDVLIKVGNMIRRTTNPIEFLARKRREKLETEVDAERYDVTKVLYRDITWKIRNKALNNIHCRGGVTRGKSTVAAALMLYGMMEKIRLLGIKTDLDKLDKNIFGEQVEFLRKVKGLKDTFIQIDEGNRAVNIGHNATTEIEIYNQWSDQMAQRYVDKVLCSPAEITDVNSDVILEIIGRDDKSMITTVRVIHRNISNGKQIIIGYADIDVSQVITTKWYKRYRDKKFARMDLLEKHGFPDPRKPEFAFIAMQAYSELAVVASSMKADLDLVKGAVDKVVRKEGRTYSMPAMEEIERKVRMLLGLLYKKNMLDARYNKLYLTKKSEGDKEEEMKKVKIAQKKINELHKEAIEEEIKRSDIYVKYMGL